MDATVTTVKTTGTIQSSLSFAGERKNATLLNSSDGVNSETFTRFSCYDA